MVEWLQKPEPVRDAGGSGTAAVTPWEMQLLQEIVELYETAEAEDAPAQRDAIWPAAAKAMGPWG